MFANSHGCELALVLAPLVAHHWLLLSWSPNLSFALDLATVQQCLGFGLGRQPVKNPLELVRSWFD